MAEDKSVAVELSRPAKRSWFRLTVGKQLGIAFLLLALIAGYISYVSRQYHFEVTSLAEMINTAGGLRVLSQRITLSTIIVKPGGSADSGDFASMLDDFSAGVAKVHHSMQGLPANAERDELATALARLVQQWGQYQNTLSALLQRPPDSRQSTAAVSALMKDTDQLLNLAESLVKNTISANLAAEKRLTAAKNTAVATALALIVSVFFYVQRYVSLRLRTLANLANRFAHGDMSVRVPFRSSDEIGDLSAALNHSAGRIQNLVQNLNQQRERALSNESRLHSVLESAGSGILLLDRTGNGWQISYVNPAFQQITGYQPDNILGQDLMFLFGDDLDQPAIASVEHSLSTSHPFKAVLRSYRRDGTLFFNEFNITPVSGTTSDDSQFVVLIDDITQQKRYEEQLASHAHYDLLTGLPNRSLLFDRIAQAQERTSQRGTVVAVVHVDIDNFKMINEGYGHGMGDLLLKSFARSFRACTRLEDTIARIAGDEFVIVAELDRPEQVPDYVKQALTCLAKPFMVGSQEFIITASAGTAIAPEHGTEPELLLMNASSALHQAKISGKNCHHIYSREITRHTRQSLIITNDLKRALDKDQFQLYYQPQVDAATGRVIGVESLIRWQHPERGMIPPNEFIPIAEQTGLIVPIGEWVFQEACRQAREWLDAGLDIPRVAINFSPLQFSRPDVPRTLARAIEHCGLPPEYLEVEITESLLMQNPEGSIDTLNALKCLGLSIAIDDFGTGYSSLAYLKRFPVDKLKIDGAFVRDIITDPSSAIIALTVIAMAQTLNLRVIAECVETEAQFAYLYRHRCLEIQGYYFSRPLPAPEFRQLLETGGSFDVSAVLDAEQQPTLLLVDDEQNVLRAIKRALRRENYRILTANSPAEAFDVLARQTVDVVLSDQRMPEMTGSEFLSRVKELYPDTLRLILSGYTELETVIESINSGAIYKFLAKPWNDEQLRENLREAFRRRAEMFEHLRLSRELDMLKARLAQKSQ